MRHQEGKCKYKPAPENTVEVETKLGGVCLKDLDGPTEDQVKKDTGDALLEAAELEDDPDAVEVSLEDDCVGARRLLSQMDARRKLSKSGVIVKGVLDLEEKIGIMEGEQEEAGGNVDLVKEMDSLKVAVQKDVSKSSVQKKILTKAKNNKGVKEAAQGEITLTAVEAEMTTQSATKAPTEAPTMPPSAEKLAGSDTSTASPDASSDSGADDDTSTGLSPTPAPDADDSGTDDSAPDGDAVDAVVSINAFSGMLYGTVVAMLMQ